MEYQFTAVYMEDLAEEGGGFTVYIEEMPGVISQDDTLEEARENIKDALQLIIQANREQSNAGDANALSIIREAITLSAGY